MNNQSKSTGITREMAKQVSKDLISNPVTKFLASTLAGNLPHKFRQRLEGKLGVDSATMSKRSMGANLLIYPTVAYSLAKAYSSDKGMVYPVLAAGISLIYSAIVEGQFRVISNSHSKSYPASLPGKIASIPLEIADYFKTTYQNSRQKLAGQGK